MVSSPNSIAIVGNGPSSSRWIEMGLIHHIPKNYDEVWAVNRGGKIFQHNKLWVMDDLVGEAESDPTYGEFLKLHDKPIITSKRYEQFPTSITYPLSAVQKHYSPHPVYFRNSIPYLLAYAGMIGVSRIAMFGCDYTFPGTEQREDHRANTEYWVGVLRQQRIEIWIVPTSTLCSVNESNVLYGYKEMVGGLL